MLVLLRFTVDEAEGDGAEDAFVGQAHEAMEALAARPGYRSGTLARAYDDPSLWCLAMEWDSVGSYRRALSHYDVKLRGTPLLARAVPEASAFEPLASAEPGGPVSTARSDRAEIPSRP